MKFSSLQNYLSHYVALFIRTCNSVTFIKDRRVPLVECRTLRIRTSRVRFPSGERFSRDLHIFQRCANTDMEPFVKEEI